MSTLIGIAVFVLAAVGWMAWEVGGAPEIYEDENFEDQEP